MSIDYAHTPVIPPPPGVTSNFVNPESRAHIFIATSAVCCSLMIPIVIMRLYSRVWINRSFAVDDAACALATIGTVAYAAVMWTSSDVLGHHMWDVSVIRFSEAYVRRALLIGTMYGPTIFFAKLSLFWLFLRVFSPNRRMRYLIYFGIVSTFAVYMSTSAYFGYMCIPRPGQSWLERASGPCKTRLVVYTQGIVGVISDLYLFILPIPIVWKLQVPLRKKIGICVVFATGSLACIASFLGLYYRITTFWKADYSWLVLPLEVLMVIELSVGVMCGSMPHLVSLFRHHRVKSAFTSLKNLSSRISCKISKQFILSKQSRGLKHGTFNRVDSDSSKEHYIETEVLGSVQGEGRFLNSGDHAQREWMWRASDLLKTQGLPTPREAWD